MNFKAAMIGFGFGSILALTACAPQKFMAAFGPQRSSQESCGFVQNVYGERISWKGQLPIRLSVHESVPTEFYPNIEEAIKGWETSTGRQIFEVVRWGSRGPALPRQDGDNVIYMLDSWEEAKKTEQARTSVYWVGDQIREADIRLNGKDFAFYSNAAAAGREVHMTSLVIHELGHVLGLKHEDQGGSVMATYLASNTVRSAISDSDMNSVRCEY